ncbi:MAG: sensor histidine kinase, partial [Cyclobacteriaceae bacterium]
TSFRQLVNRLENTIKGLTGILQVQKTDESAAKEIHFESLVNDILLEHKDTIKVCEGTFQYDFNEKQSIRYIEPFLISIMKNLVNNAIKYCRDDVQLVINISTSVKNGFILLKISDNGIGIDLEKHKDQLFSPFKRLSPKKAEGTGVGLYIIKSIIEKNWGYIEVESTPGEGTTFYCYLREY